MLPILTRASRRALARWAGGLLGLVVHQWGADLPRPAAAANGGAYVSMVRLEGPSPRGAWDRDLQVELPASTTLTVLPGLELVGGWARVVINDRDVSRETLAPETLTDSRDALLALLQAEDDVRATFAVQGAHEIVVTPTALGAVLRVVAQGLVSALDVLEPASLSIGIARSRMRVTVHQPAGPAATESAGVDGLGAQLLADLKETDTKFALARYGVKVNGLGRKLQVRQMRQPGKSGSSEVRAFFDLFYSEPAWTARPENALEAVDLTDAGGLTLADEANVTLDPFDLIFGETP